MNQTIGSQTPNAAATPAVAEKASEVAEKASEVGAEAGAQVKAVAQEASDHLRSLADRARSDVRQQAQTRTGQAAEGVRTLSSQLDALATGNVDGAGPLADYLRDASARVSRFAGELDRGPEAVLDDVASFARRRPMVFLGAAGVLGFAAGRMLRSGAAASSNDEPAGSYPSASRPSTSTLSSNTTDLAATAPSAATPAAPNVVRP